MVTNLPEKSKAIWAKAIVERDPERKLQLLREFYSSFPKHKATEKLEVSIKRQIASLEEKIERSRAKKGARAPQVWSVKKEEIQVCVLGPAGRLSFFSSMFMERSFQEYEIHQRPCVSVIRNDSTSFQSVLLPFDRQMNESRQRAISSILRNTDCILLIGTCEEISDELEWLEENNIHCLSSDTYVELKYTTNGGIRIIGVEQDGIRKLLNDYGIKNAFVYLSKNSSIDDIEAAIFGKAFKKAFTLIDCNLRGVDFIKAASKEELVERILSSLSLIRVFTVSSNGNVSERPLILRKGSTVMDAAERIHKEFSRRFSYARVWRPGTYNGERVGREFLLSDNDLIEIHTS